MNSHRPINIVHSLSRSGKLVLQVADKTVHGGCNYVTLNFSTFLLLSMSQVPSYKS